MFSQPWGLPVTPAHLATGDSDLSVVAWREADMSLTSRVYVYRWNGTAWASVGALIEGRG